MSLETKGAKGEGEEKEKVWFTQVEKREGEENDSKLVYRMKPKNLIIK